MGRQKRKSERNFSRKKRYFAIRFFVKSSLVIFKRFEEIDALRRNCETRALDFFGTAASRLRPRESNERIVFFKKKKKEKKSIKRYQQTASSPHVRSLCFNFIRVSSMLFLLLKFCISSSPNFSRTEQNRSSGGNVIFLFISLKIDLEAIHKRVFLSHC